MGGAIARRVHASGHDVALWNRDRRKAEELALGRVFDTPKGLAAASDVVVSSLADPAALRDVYLGQDGAVGGARGQTFIDTSTAGPDVEIEISAALRQHRSELLDAPIAGVPAAVADGSALVLLSGDAPRAEAARRLLESLGTVRYVGALGTASRLKLISNTMVALTNAAAAELLRLARSSGLDTGIVFDLLARQAPGLAVRREHYTTSGTPPVVFSASGMLKDLDLALDLPGARDLLPLTSAVRRLVAELAEAQPEADLSALTFSTPRA
jgi:3-hydroxyisobutyrate dehydrogenase-like beta-hydroxyacid dehydrogenase